MSCRRYGERSLERSGISQREIRYRRILKGPGRGGREGHALPDIPECPRLFSCPDLIHMQPRTERVSPDPRRRPTSTVVQSDPNIEQILVQNEYWQGSTSIYPAVETSLLGLRDILGFAFPNPGEVVEYLVQNPGLYDVVMYACSMTAEEFGSTSGITLDIFHDSESGDRYLTLYVRQKKYDDDIIARMDRICDLYEPGLNGLSGWLLLTTDYKPPSI